MFSENRERNRLAEDDRQRRETITYIGLLPDPFDTAIDDVSENQMLGGNCVRCEREGWIDRHQLGEKWGNAILASLQPRLRCLGCGNNNNGNRWIIGKASG